MHKIASWIFLVPFGFFAIGFASSGETPNWKEPALALESDPILKKKALPLDSTFFSSADLAQITSALAKEMFSHFGISGIAAPQLGVGLRIFLLRSSFINPFNRSYDVYINPSITPTGDSTNSRIEFCLSAKGFHWITRYKAIRLEFYKVDGTQQVVELTGSRARIAQHELDHLDGKLISDEYVHSLNPGSASSDL
jgi:peptide deformylase